MGATSRLSHAYILLTPAADLLFLFGDVEGPKELCADISAHLNTASGLNGPVNCGPFLWRLDSPDRVVTLPGRFDRTVRFLFLRLMDITLGRVEAIISSNHLRLTSDRQ
jgi:hypothetical protein